MPEVYLTSRAKLRLREIESCSLDQWGEKVTETYFNHFEHAISEIQKSTDVLEKIPEFESSFSFFRVKNHVLVCDVKDEETVFILTVFHLSMNISQKLMDYETRLIAEAEFLHERLKSQK